MTVSRGSEAAVHGLSVLFSKKRDCHTLLQKFIQLRIAKGAPLAAEADAGSMALVPHAEEQPQQVLRDASETASWEKFMHN